MTSFPIRRPRHPPPVPRYSAFRKAPPGNTVDEAERRRTPFGHGLEGIKDKVQKDLLQGSPDFLLRKANLLEISYHLHFFIP